MFSRRAFLIGGAGVAWASDPPKAILPSEAKRYNDAVTEFQVVRLTAPEHTAALTAYFNRGIAGRNFLLYGSDRAGKMDVYRLDLKTFENRKLTDGDAVRPETIDLLPGDRNFIVADGTILRLLPTNGGKQRELYTASGDIVAASASEDGAHAAVIDRRDGRFRLTLISVPKGRSRMLVEADEPLSDPVHRKQRDSVLFRRGADAIWLANYDGQQTYRLRLPGRHVADPQWSPDGRGVLYLLIPDDPAQRAQIREFTPDSNDDKLVASTSRFVQFSANTDASVFVGASGSKAAPHVMLLLRSVKREFTLCEHHASNPNAVVPVFSPNSQRVFFITDQHGKPAIYTLNVERLVEET